MSTTASSAEIKPVGELFADDTVYRIPVYQRNYAWGAEEIKQLIDDIRDAAEDDDIEEYFLGNVVVDLDRTGKHEINEFEVIDGQQRLTTLFMLLSFLRTPAFDGAYEHVPLNPLVYQTRQKASMALARLTSHSHVLERAAELDASEEDAAILNGFTVISQYIVGALAETFRSPDVVQFILQHVVVVRFQIPHGTDLNRYFEIMNTRGEQLRQQDIVKARLMSELADDLDRACFARVWDACSDMDSYIQMTLTPGDTGLRGLLFGADWSWLEARSFDHVRDILFPPSTDPHNPGGRPRVASSTPLRAALIAGARKPSLSRVLMSLTSASTRAFSSPHFCSTH